MTERNEIECLSRETSDTSGCDFEEIERHEGCTVIIDKCVRCGKVSFGWKKDDDDDDRDEWIPIGIIGPEGDFHSTFSDFAEQFGRAMAEKIDRDIMEVRKKSDDPRT